MRLFININYIAGIDTFKRYNRLTMFEEVLKAFLEIPQVVCIIKKWGLSIRIDIKKIINMA